MSLLGDGGGADESTDEVVRSARSLGDSVLSALPRAGIALGIVVAGWLGSRAVRWIVFRVLRRRRSPSFAMVMSKLSGWIFLLVVILVALAVTFPSIKPVDLLAGLGFFSVAVGFAFQDILENTLAGVLLLFRQPFRSGDQIEVDDHIGTVEAITIRETRLRSFDGQLVIIPNRDVYKNAIRVQTDTPSIRWDFCLGVAYGTDLDRLVPELVASVASVRGVAENPAPLVLVRELAASSVNLEVRFWAAAVELDGLTVLSHAFRAALRTAERLGVDITPDVLRLVDGPSPPSGPPT